MPKAPKATVTGTTKSARNNPHLPRNQACHQCRKKKLKCDAGKPCSTCVKAHAHKVAPLMVKGESFDPNPNCTYDEPLDESSMYIGSSEHVETLSPPEVVADAPITGLGDQISFPIIASETSILQSPNSSVQAELSRSACIYSYDWTSIPHEHREDIYEKLTNLSPSLPVSTPNIQSPFSLDPSTPSNPSSPSSISQSTTIVPTAYSPTLPPPQLMMRLVEIFFQHITHASRLVHRLSFLTALLEGPNSPRYPATSILHAICAIASVHSHEIPGKPMPDLKYQPVFCPFVRVEDLELEQGVSGGLEGSFGIQHAAMAKALMEFDTRIGARVLDAVRTTIILGWYYHINAQWADLWMMTGTTIRTCVPLGLNLSTLMGSSTVLAAMEATTLVRKNDSALEQEKRRFIWWCAYLNEINQSTCTLWVPAITEASITQELPGKFADYESGNIAAGPRQRLSDKDVLTNHPPHLTDAYTMHLKGCILIMRVGTFNTQSALRRQADINHGLFPPEAAFSPSSLFSDLTLGPSSPSMDIRSNHISYQWSVRELPAFKALDSAIVAFQLSIPKEYRDPWAPRNNWSGVFPSRSSVPSLDHNLYSLNVLPHVATMMLHEPHADMLSSSCMSKQKIVSAALAVLHTVHILVAESYDPTLLPSYCCLYWMATAKVLLKAYKGCLEMDLKEEAQALRGGVEVLRLVFAKVGEKAEVAYRTANIVSEMLSTVETGNVSGKIRII